MSIDLMGLHLRVEDKFKIRLPDTPIKEIDWNHDPQVQDLVDYVAKVVAKQNPDQNYLVFERVRDAIAEEMNIPLSEITLNSYLIRDLRLN